MANVVGAMPPRPLRRDLGANERLRAAMVFRRHRAGEVDRAAGDVRVNIDAAGKDDHPRRIDRPAAVDRRDESARIVDAEVFDLAVDAVGRVVDFSARDSKHGLPELATGSPDCRSRSYTCDVNHLRLASIGQPERLLGDRLVDPANDFFIGRIRRLQRRLQRHRDLVHAIRRARRGNSLGSRRDMHAGQLAGVRDVRVEHDRRNPLQVLDRRLRHRCARIGSDDERRVAIAANQDIDRRELARVVARIAAIERDAERKAGLPAHDHVGPGHVAVAAHRHRDKLRERVHLRGQHEQRGAVHVLAAGHRQAHAEEHAAKLAAFMR